MQLQDYQYLDVKTTKNCFNRTTVYKCTFSFETLVDEVKTCGYGDDDWAYRGKSVIIALFLSSDCRVLDASSKCIFIQSNHPLQAETFQWRL